MKLISTILFCWCIATAALAQTKPYRSDSVQFKNAAGTINFGGTLTTPVKNNTHIAIVIVSGTGKQDRDGKMSGHLWFANLADYFGHKGISVLRLDDRGVGQTTGAYENSTTADFAADALEAVAYLKSRNDLGLKKIGLLGHSEGGAGISIAAAQSKDVAFLISLAGLATSGVDAQIIQNLEGVAALDMPEYNKKRFNEINEIMFRTAFKYADSANMDAKLKEAHAAWKKRDSIAVKALNLKSDRFGFPIYLYALNAVTPWYRYFIKYDPENYLPKVKIPILAINGSSDSWVKPGPNLANWKALPLKGGNKKVTVVEIPGLNHLLQHCVTCLPQEYATIKEDIAPEVLSTLDAWLKHNNLGK
ncbi:alpha/beta hydrolase [Pedobacter sp. MC2016-14]|uniref:alpha/beta hydrolase family protein n=1 Tax=Pedobacter sp. MC2016-14 TaxID=2897327 RepID=UPI001E3A1422|nr:alpha/beta fold hydrolase [Pedobacter sp. MC2016-14]MCD0490391.1 alpha/beta hydrolase [Pedobacter sp. MC2016-14]